MKIKTSFVLILAISLTLLTPIASANENSKGIFWVASTLGGNGVRLADIVKILESELEQATNTKNRGLIYIAMKDIESSAQTIILQGELLGVSSLIRGNEKHNYYPHLTKVIQKGKSIIEIKLQTIKEIKTELTDNHTMSLLDESINLIKNSLSLLDKGVTYLQ